MHVKRSKKDNLMRLYKRVNAGLQIYRPETFFKEFFY
jgi:hypothetical protein